MEMYKSGPNGTPGNKKYNVEIKNTLDVMN